jgi:hypothetical protein
MTDVELIEDFRKAFNSGCDYLVIYSRRQDIGINKCERGVELGLLRFKEHVVDSQETHWRYYWTDEARKLFG